MKIRNTGRILAVVVLLAGILAAAGMIAYLADGDRHRNPFSIGYNKITPEEEFEDPEPGKKTVKKPCAVNTGTVDCYVRAKVYLTDSRAEEYISWYYNENDGMNTQDWIEGADGWLYYKAPLAVQEESSPLFTHIKLEKEIPEEILEFSVDVVFESAQSYGFESAEAAFQALEGNRQEESV